MEPMEINGGRFYVRPLHDDDRIDDRPALSLVEGTQVADDIVAIARQDWASNRRFTWAVCEQTSVELLALAELILPESFDPDAPQQQLPASLRVRPAGDTARILPNDPVLTQKTVGDAVEEGRGTVRRWAEGFLGLTVTEV